MNQDKRVRVYTVDECPANRCEVHDCGPRSCLCTPCDCLRCRGQTLRAHNGKIAELATVMPARYEQLTLDPVAERHEQTERMLGERDVEAWWL